MNKVYQKHKWRSVGSNLSRFLAIFGIVALGAGFLSGLLAVTPDMRASVDAYYDENRLMDVRVVSTLGLTDEDLQAVRDTQGVQEAEPGYSVDILADTAGEKEVATRVHSLPQEINRLELLDGRLPESENECVVDIPTGLGLDISVGETLTFDLEGSGQEDAFSSSTYTVVGIVNSARYFSIDRENTSVGNGSISLFVYLPKESFSLDAYTDIYLLVNGAAQQEAFSREYDDTIATVTQRLEELAQSRAQARTGEVVAEAKNQLEEARQEYETAKADTEKKLEEARQQIEEGQQEIDDGQAALDEGWAQLEQGETALEEQRINAQEQISSMQSSLEEAREQWINGQSQINQAQQQLETAATQLQEGWEQLAALEAAGQTDQAQALQAQLETQQAAYNEGMQQLEEQKAALEASAEQIEEGGRQLQAAAEQAQAALDEARQRLDDSRTALEASALELDEARQKLEQAKTEFEESEQQAQAELEDGQAELDQAQQDIDEIAPAEWYVMDRSNILSYSSFNDNAEKVAAIAVVFPVFFCLVAALVALTTMTRMVEEERIQIGTFKALGYSNGAIIGKYLLYAGIATALGCVVGIAVGFQVFPRVIWNAYGIMYDLPALHAEFHWGMAAIIFGSLFVCILAATLGACYGILRQNTAQLLLPRAPKAGKRIFLEHIRPVWKHLTFIQKVTARNIFRYKKRFFMTILGVAGCTALLLTGVGLRGSINGLVGRQFDDLYHYTLMIGLQDADALTENEDLAAIMGDTQRIEDYLPMAQSSVDAMGDGVTKTAYISVPQDVEKLPDYVTLRERKSQKTLSLTDDGAIVTEKLARQLDLSVGDTFRVMDTDNRSATIKVGGITEHYVQNYIYMTPTAYEQAFGFAPDYTVLNAKPAEGLDRDQMSSDLLATGGVALVQFTDTLRDNLNDTLGSIDYIVLVLIICAGLLAFVVLYNLTNINITERQKELATIKVLGFYDREVSSYIYRETTILMLIGTVVGLVLGIALHAFVVQTAEVDMVMFVRQLEWTSYVFAAILTILFSIIVDVAMIPRLKKIDMVESMKAGE